MKRGELILIGGGVRSGKSAFAVDVGRRLGDRRVFIATAEARDAEMHERIAQHRIQRGADFETVEAPLDLLGALQKIEATDVVIIDCLTLWLSNQLIRERAQQSILQELEAIIELLRHRSFHTAIVTNEVGMGIVPTSSLGRLFRDVVGKAHQYLSANATQIYFAALGLMLRLRPGPVTVMDQWR